MNLIMWGINYNKTPINLREKFCFDEKKIESLLKKVYALENVEGCALLSTCNRCEIYVSGSEKEKIKEILLKYSQCGENFSDEYFIFKSGEDAVLYLIEVACGIHSQIFHESQIITQVNNAIKIARKCKTTDSFIDTLFRKAVTAGKYSQTNILTQNVPVSASYEAVEFLKKRYNDKISQKKCLVIGNGKMGKLASDLLVSLGCMVKITLRTYRHGESVVPRGTVPVFYENRIEELENADIVISATSSPHYTVTKSQLEKISKKPEIIIDLALPRDIDENCKTIEGVEIFDLDDFKTKRDKNEVLKLKNTALKYKEEFLNWNDYRLSVPYITLMKEIITDRMMNTNKLEIYRNDENFEEIARLVCENTVDIIMGAIKEEVCPEMIKSACEKISDRSR
jgi:glutamyl-tRNA reductase